MSIAGVLDLLRCPICGGGFALVDRSVRCAAGHSFDLARSGYLNLLGRSAPAHADTAEMVAARDRILSAGHLDPLSNALLLAAVEAIGRPPSPDLLEVGAGTGHHLAHLVEDLAGRGVALDISVPASRRAAQAHDRLGAVVADVWQRFPLADAGFDVVLGVFAPRHPEELVRVLRPGGVLLIATPTPEHLVELRESLGLLQVEPAKDERLTASLEPHFTLTGRRESRYRLELDAPEVVDLIAMGPNAFHRSRDRLSDQVRALGDRQPVTVSVAVSAWTPR